MKKSGVCLVGFFLWAVIGCASEPVPKSDQPKALVQAEQPPARAESPPQVDLYGMDANDTVRRLSEFRGKPVIITTLFGASTSSDQDVGVTMFQGGHLSDYYGLPHLMVMSCKDDRQAVAEMRRELAGFIPNMQVLCTHEDIARLLGLTPDPSTILVDSHGRIRSRVKLDEIAKLEAKIKELEGEDSAPAALQPRSEFTGTFCVARGNFWYGLPPEYNLEDVRHAARGAAGLASLRFAVDTAGVEVVDSATGKTYEGRVTMADEQWLAAEFDETLPYLTNRDSVLFEFEEGIVYFWSANHGALGYWSLAEPKDCARGAISEKPVEPPNNPLSWATGAPESWPQIVLTNEATFSDGRVLNGAAAFLIRSGDGTPVIATARHLIEEAGGFNPKFTIQQYDSQIESWSVFPRTQPGKRVTGAKRITDYPHGWVDALAIELTNPPESLPAKVLEPREEPVRPGERVVIFGCEYRESDCIQRAWTGRVHVANALNFFVILDSTVNLRGFSGGPIVDMNGRALGIMTGGYEVEDDVDAGIHVTSVKFLGL